MNQHSDSAGVDWPVLIGHLVLVHQRQGELMGGAYEDRVPPRAGASEEQVAALEERFGPLEATYRSFLAHVNGWQDFTAGIALLDVEAMCDPATQAGLERYFEIIEHEDSEAEELLVVEDVFAISAIFDSGDVLLAGRAGSPIAGQVMWWTPAGEQSRHLTFADYVAASIELEEHALESAGHPRVAPRARYDTAGDARYGPRPGAVHDDLDLDGSRAVAAQVAAARTMLTRPGAIWDLSAVVRALSGLKTALAARGHGRTWGDPPTTSGATVAGIEAVLALYGLKHLPGGYSEVLRAVDGWANILPGIDLLTVAQLQDAEVMRPAVTHAAAVLTAAGLEIDDHLVVARGQDSQDTIVVTLHRSKVLWLRGHDQVVATYADLRAWMLMVTTHHLTALDQPPATLHSPL